MKALFSAFRYFLLCISSPLNFFYHIAKFFPNCHICIKNFFMFFHEYMHLILSEYLLYIPISGKNMHKGLIFFIISVTNEIFKILFTKRKLIRYYYFVNIYIVYQKRTFILMKFVFFNFSVIKFYNFFNPFLYGFNFFNFFFIHDFLGFYSEVNL